MNIDFEHFFSITIKLLEEISMEYLVIGGIAAGVWGKPRFTQDIDVVINPDKKKIPSLLKRAREYGFNFEDETEARLKSTGIARLKFGTKALDIISAFVEFEKSALKRKKEIEIFNRKIYVASPEDLILYKLISARSIDIADIENIVSVQKKELDKEYLKKWGRILGAQLDIPRIEERLKEILK